MQNSTSLKNWTPLSLLMLLGFLWGTAYTIARFVMTNGVNPLGYSFWLSLGPAILIGFITWINKEKLSFSAPHCRYYFICGLTGIVLPNTNMYFAASHLPAGILAVIVNIVPILAYPMALFAQSEPFSRLRFSAVLCALSGLMLILLPQTSLPSPDMVPWILSALLTPLCFAFCSVYISRQRPANSHTLSLATGTLIFSSLMLTPIVLFSGHFYALHFPLSPPDWIILLEIVLSSLGYILFFTLIKIAGPVYYSFVDTIVAVTGLFWAYLIFDEKLNIWTGSAVVFILLSLVLISKRRRAMLNYSATA